MDYWRRAIEKETKNVRVAFQRWNGDGRGQGPSSLQGYQEIKFHMIFDIKVMAISQGKTGLWLVGILQRHLHLPLIQVLYQEKV